MSAVNNEARKMHDTKTALIRNAKEIWDSRLEKKEEDRLTGLQAQNLGMIKKEDLINGHQYFGYGEKSTGAYWLEKAQNFICTPPDGYKISLKYFDEFIPMVDEEDLQPEKDYTIEELQKAHKDELKVLTKIKKEYRALTIMLNEQQAKVSNARNLFEKKLVGEE